MDHQPIISYSGSENLFRTLEPLIISALPLDSCEWKRTHGRPNKNVKINAKFEEFDTKILDQYKCGEWSILRNPVLHIYVTECNDVDTYKANIKKDIDDWIKVLTAYGITDWMILLVETVDIKKTKNILPRTTVLDKLRLDFGAKHTDRCISVLNPIKFEVKSTESFRCLLNRIRLLVLTGYNKSIVKFEELIRENREKRNQEGWSFINYFLLQEQLAFVLEMLGLPLEALVQYDELDAMYSQFILNSVYGDQQKWLDSFRKPFNSFHGISTNKKRMAEIRGKIIENDASLLEFRSYLFARQIILLFTADQFSEIAERLLPFILATLGEIEALKNETPDGSLQCWQIVCALEILQICDVGVKNKEETVNIFRHTAAIYDLAKTNLFELGKLCGLLPGNTPTSEQLHIVVLLSAGVGDTIMDDNFDCNSAGNENEQTNFITNKPSAIERLKDALGSGQSFQKLFMELCELAISGYKLVERLRSARLVGLDLGHFYCSLSQPQKAIIFFGDLLRELKNENWTYLASQTLLELVCCYKKLGDPVLYMKTCAAISCCIDLEFVVRVYHFDEFLASNKLIDLEKHTTAIGDGGSGVVGVGGGAGGVVKPITHILASLEDHFKLIDVNVLLADNIIQDETVEVTIKIESKFPREMCSNEISLSFEPPKLDIKTPKTAIMPIIKHLDYKQDGTLESSSVMCSRKEKQPVRRKSSVLRKVSTTVRNDFTNAVTAKNIVLKPGINEIRLTSPANRVGIWVFEQLSIRIDKLEFLSESLPVKCEKFEITSKAATVTLNYQNLVAGIVQPVELQLFAGSFVYAENANIHVKCSKRLHIRSANTNNLTNFSSEMIIPLENIKSFDEKLINLEVVCDLPGQKDERPIEHCVMLLCPWSRNEIQIALFFMPPITASCRLHSSDTRKFLQVLIKGVETKLFVFNARMTCDAKGIKLIQKNEKYHRSISGGGIKHNDDDDDDDDKKIKQKKFEIKKGMQISFIWEFEVEPLKAEHELPFVKVNFNLQYSHINSAIDSKIREYQCKFDVQDYKTLFNIQAIVEPSELCRVGSVCQLKLKITKIQETQFTELLYEVIGDQNTWAMCGQSAGVISMKEVDSQSTILDIMPLNSGFLPMPNIKLSKYVSVNNTENPKLFQFPPGQVYNSTKSIQIHVLASHFVD